MPTARSSSTLPGRDCAQRWGPVMASRTCWNCEQASHQTMVLDPVTEKVAGGRSQAAEYKWFAAYTCDECGHLTVGTARYVHGQVNLGHQAKPRMDAPDADLEWLPDLVQGRRFDDVPTTVSDAAPEAFKSADVLHFMSEVLNEVYQSEARINAFRAQRIARKAQADAGVEPEAD